jgi:hypothetical protein
VSAFTRRQLLARGGGAAAAVALGRSFAPTAAAGAREHGAPREVHAGATLPGGDAGARAADSATVQTYLAFMDTVVERILPQWSEWRGAYHAPRGTFATVINARMLQVHAGAATAGHTGPSRDDARARQLVQTLLDTPAPWRVSGAGVPHEKMFHLPGWTTSLTDPDAVMDKAVDPQVAQALVAAWRAGATLGLDAPTLQTIVQAVSAVARCTFFRYPGIRLNQLNWNCALYALDAELTGATDLLRGDYREQMLRFATFATRTEHPGGSTNLGPGWHFHYLPNYVASAMANLDAPEYASEVLDCVRHYSAALAAGMEPLPRWALDVFRAYAARTLYGDWTHAGYLNWDTGLGAQRRYIGKVFAFAQQGLMALAISPVAQSIPGMGTHARWLFDRGLDLYLRWLAEAPAGQLPPPVQFGEDEHAEGPDDRLLFGARIASNAAQAIALDLAAVPPVQPPPMYSFDPDSQRLAVSTPTYSTAILVHNRDAVPYGGLDLCRLFDATQRPVGSIAGTGLANFAARIRDSGGGLLLDTQMGDTASMSVVAVLPDGSARRAGPASAPYPRDAYAGPMRSVTASGRVAHGSAAIATTHRLLPDTILLVWELTMPPHTSWELALPSYGLQASWSVEHAGSASPSALDIGASGPPVSAVRRILGRTEGSGYIITPVKAPPGARLSAVHPPSDTGAARPGPTLLIAGVHSSARASSVTLALELRVG